MNGEVKTTTQIQLWRTQKSTTYFRGWAKAKKLAETQRAIGYVTDMFAHSVRKDGYLYLDHLVSTASDLAMLNWDAIPSINQDKLFATMLLHDVCEDCGIAPQELPFTPEIQRAVSLVTIDYGPCPKSLTAAQKAEIKDRYFRNLLKDPVSVIVKGMDRLYNLTTMDGALKDEAIRRNIIETDKKLLPILQEAAELYPEITDILRFLYKFNRIFNSDLAYYRDIPVSSMPFNFIGNHRLLGMSVKAEHLEVYENTLPETVHAIRYRREKMKNVGEVDQSILNNFVSTASDLLLFDWDSIPSISQDQFYAVMILRDVCKDCNIAPQSLPFSQDVKDSVALLSFSYGHNGDKMSATEYRKALAEYFEKLLDDPIAVVVKGMNRLRRLTTLQGRVTTEEIIKQVTETDRMMLPVLTEAKNRYSELGDVLHFLHKFIRLYNTSLARHFNIETIVEPPVILGRKIILSSLSGETETKEN